MARVTMRDIAAAAGVGTATVERALNGRGNVGEETAERILRVAKRLGYRAPPRGRAGVISIEVVLVRPETQFYARFSEAFRRIAATLDKDVQIQRTFVPEDDPQAFARHIAQPALRRSALIVVAPDHPDVMRAIRGVRVPVVQLMTRPAPDLPYVGIDNYAAGRSAAMFLTRLHPGRSGSFVALCHSGAYENHRQRIRGFSDWLADHPGSGFDFQEVIFDGDDAALTRRLLRAALARHGPLAGLYSAGGDSAAIAGVLRDLPGAAPLWIGHELSPSTRGFLKEGLMTLVLDQVPEAQARMAIDTVLRALGVLDAGGAAPAQVRFLTVSAENC